MRLGNSEQFDGLDTHLCSTHDLDLLAYPNDQDEFLAERVLVVVVFHLDVCKRRALRLEVRDEVREVAFAG